MSQHNVMFGGKQVYFEFPPPGVYISKRFPQSNYPIMALAGAGWRTGTKPALIYQGNFKR